MSVNTTPLLDTDASSSMIYSEMDRTTSTDESAMSTQAPDVQALADSLQQALDALKSAGVEGRGRPVLTDPLKRRRIPAWVTESGAILGMSLLIQVLNVILLFAGHDQQDTGWVDLNGGVIAILVFQACHLTFIVSLSVKLTKQVAHTTVSIWFLVQSYLSTVLLFAGFYVIAFKINPDTFPAMLDMNDKVPSPFISFCSALYVSTYMMTSVGVGDIFPATWVAQLLCICQMLLGVAYSTVVIALGIASFAARRQERLREVSMRRLVSQ